jgi:phage gpG-like protein
MNESRVEIIGLERATSDMVRWAEELAPAVDKAGEPFGERVAAEVRGRVPHRTGALAGSVDLSVDATGLVLGLGAGLPYAGWIEFGGSRGRPYVPQGRYLYPTMLAAQDEWNTIAADTAVDTAGRFPWST